MASSKKARQKGSLPCSSTFCFFIPFCLGVFYLGRFSVVPLSSEPKWHITDTLVVYIFSNNDAESLNNLRYFLRWGAKYGDGAEYVVVVQRGVWPPDSVPAEEDGPSVDWVRKQFEDGLPQHVRFFAHPNSCYDWGTFWWLLGSGHVAPLRYKFFIMVNSSVRGPYLPSYLPKNLPWHRLLTSRLVGDVHMAGPVVSCEGSPWRGNASGEWRRNPHIQSYSIAMDEVGLEVLRRDGNVTACHSDRWDAIWHYELGAALAILSAGYNIQSLLQRYQGVDWRLRENWGCNQGINPTGQDAFDGVTLSPYEVLFVKAKESLVLSAQTITIEAVKLESWLDWEGTGEVDIYSNEWVERPDLHKAPKVALLEARGSSCFDFGYYRRHNPDLVKLTDEQLWNHVRDWGQFEARGYRFTCPYPVTPVIASSVEVLHRQGHGLPARTKALGHANTGNAKPDPSPS
eukprot:jgi/Botrbrau1/9938/Bobra.0012s0035.1